MGFVTSWVSTILLVNKQLRYFFGPVQSGSENHSRVKYFHYLGVRLGWVTKPSLNPDGYQLSTKLAEHASGVSITTIVLTQECHPNWVNRSFTES